MHNKITYRTATPNDIPAISAFVDYWLAGRGIADKTPGSAHDYFVPHGRHLKFVTKYVTLLALRDNFIIGWAVKTHLGVLIHLLVAGTFRKQGIGSELLKRLNPESVRSKTDQAAGNPAQFYAGRGFTHAGLPRTGKQKNIEIWKTSATS